MQTNSKPHHTYSRWLYGTVAIAVLLGFVLGMLLLTHGPRVRFVRIDENKDQRAYTNGATIEVHFDRPLEDRDFTPHIQFKPDLKNAVSVNGQTLRVTSLEHFDHDTEYELRILPGITDTRGVQMRNTFVHRFKTAPAQFVYIERNYAREAPDNATEGALDNVIVKVAGKDNRRTVFSHPEIRMISANRTHIVVVTRETEEDVLYSVPIHGGEPRREKLLFGGRIFALSMSPLSNTALFNVVPDFSKVSRDYYDEFAYRVVALDIQTGESKPLTKGDGSYVYATSIDIDGQGQVALIQDLQGQFFAVSPYNDYEPILVGTYVLTEGIRTDASEIVFRNEFDWERYTISTSERTPLTFEFDGAIDQIQLGDGSLVSTVNFDDGGTRSEIFRYTTWSDEPERVWVENRSNTVSLYSFSASYDQSFLALQFNFDSCRFDNFEINSQCADTTTTLYDTKKGSSIDEFNGFDVVWLP